MKFEVSWCNNEKSISIMSFRKIRKQNKKDYPNDPDVNTKRQWGIHTNGAVKGKHSCLDWQLNLGHIHINYMDWAYNKRK